MKHEIEGSDLLSAHAGQGRRPLSSSLRRPPTISWVGTIEPFKDETIAYMGRLDTAGVPTSFKLYEGGFHGFEHLLPKADVSQDPIEFEGSAFAEFYDRYL